MGPGIGAHLPGCRALFLLCRRNPNLLNYPKKTLTGPHLGYGSRAGRAGVKVLGVPRVGFGDCWIRVPGSPGCLDAGSEWGRARVR